MSGCLKTKNGFKNAAVVNHSHLTFGYFDLALSKFHQKNLPAGHLANNLFCFRLNLKVSLHLETWRFDGKLNYLFPKGPVIKCVILHYRSETAGI